MAKNYKVNTTVQNFYTNKNRELTIYYSEPEDGVNEETGILLLIAGYGANTNSKVYIKMRNQMADMYNLIVVQCEYFGWEFMQTLDTSFNLQKFFIDNGTWLTNVENRFWSANLNYEHTINETQDNFNDMGVAQAIDNISTINYIMNKLSQKGIKFNKKKVLAYGHSHGAYLCYLSNAFANNLFSALIDNSAYVHPKYLKYPRALMDKFANNAVTLNIFTNYIAKDVILDKDIYDLNVIYPQFKNEAKIISFHGSNDDYLNPEDKSAFLSNINNTVFILITQDKVNNIIFKSTNHGLDADFLKLFHFVISNYDVEAKTERNFKDQHLETKNYNYTIAQESDSVILKMTSKS